MQIEEGIQVVQENFRNFIEKDGSKHIATLSSQINLYRLLKSYEPNLILDWGGGIGTLTKLCLEVVEKANIDVFERNEWCIGEFNKNIPNFRGSILKELNSANYDFVIIDDDISRAQIHKILSFPGLKVIFVEGWRNRTVGHISKRAVLHGFSAKFFRSKSQLFLFGRADEWEKSGSWFVMEHKGIHLDVLMSWISRWRSTREGKEVIKEFYYWIGRMMRPASRIKSLKTLFKVRIR